MNRVRATDHRDTGLGHTVIFDLPRFHQLGDGTCHILDRNVGINAMLIEQVDAVGSQTLERGVSHLSDVLGPAVDRQMRCPNLEAELGGDRSLVTPAFECPPEQLLIGKRTVELGRSEEGATKINARWIVAIASCSSEVP